METGRWSAITAEYPIFQHMDGDMGIPAIVALPYGTWKAAMEMELVIRCEQREDGTFEFFAHPIEWDIEDEVSEACKNEIGSGLALVRLIGRVWKTWKEEH